MERNTLSSLNSDIAEIFKNSEKSQLLETLATELETANKAIVILIQDEIPNENEGEREIQYTSCVLTLGLNNTYEAYGILDVAKHVLQDEEN